jgi:hypothetical protein
MLLEIMSNLSPNDPIVVAMLWHQRYEMWGLPVVKPNASALTDLLLVLVVEQLLLLFESTEYTHSSHSSHSFTLTDLITGSAGFALKVFKVWISME